MKKLLIVITLWCSVFTVNAALISIDIEDRLYQQGDILTANIYLSELDIGPQQLVSEYIFNLMSSDSLLTFQTISFGNKLDVDFFMSDQVFDNSGVDSVVVEEFSFAEEFELLAAQNGLITFLLASIDFKVESLGLADFAITSIIVADANGDEYAAFGTQNASVRLGNQVSVPEPSTIVIFGLAVILLFGASRLRKN